MTYTTAALVEAELRLTTPFSGSTSPSLAQVTTWINEESAMVDSYSSSPVASATYTDVINYKGEDRLQLSHSPVISVTSLLYSTSKLGTSTYALTDTKVEDTDFTVFKDTGEVEILFNNWRPQEGLKRMSITYVAGQATTPLTMQKLATKMVAQRVIETAIENSINESKYGKTVSVGNITISKNVSMGTSQYAELSNQIATLKNDLLTGFKVYRYINY